MSYHKRSFFVFLTLFFISFSVNAQSDLNDALLDSVSYYKDEFQWDKSWSVFNRIDSMSLSKEQEIRYLLAKGTLLNHEKDYENSFLTYQKSYHKATALSHLEYMAKGSYLMGLTHFNRTQLDSAKYYFKKTLEIKAHPNYSKPTDYIVFAYNGLGVIAKQRDEIEESIYWYEQGIEENKKTDKDLSGYFLINLMSLYMANNDLFSATRYSLKNIERGDRVNEFVPQAMGYTTLGEVYYKQGNIEAALRMFSEADSFWCRGLPEFADNYNALMSQIGNCHLDMGESAVAYAYFAQDSSFLAHTPDRELDKIISYLDLSKYRRQIGAPKQALLMSEAAARIIRERKLNNFKSKMHFETGLTFNQLTKRDSAIFHFKQAINTAKPLDYETKYRACMQLAKLFQNQSKTKKALNFALHAQGYSDSLRLALNSVEVTSFLLEYEKEKQELQYLAETQSKQQEVQYQTQLKRLLFFLFISTIGVIILLISRYRQKAKFADTLNEEVEKKTEELAFSNAQLNRSQEDLRNFYAIMAHDFRYPILATQANLKNIAADKLNKNQSVLIDASQTTLQNLYDSFKTILRFFRQESETLFKQDTQLSALVDDLKCTELNLPRFQHLSVEYDDLPKLSCDTMLIRQVFFNLMANAAKYTKGEANPLLRITGKETASKWIIIFNDNGSGVSDSVKNKLFSSFVTDSKKEESHIGMGLFFVKRIIERHQGTIRLASDKYALKGAAFEIILPKS